MAFIVKIKRLSFFSVYLTVFSSFDINSINKPRFNLKYNVMRKKIDT